MKKNIAVIILAAGKGERMKSNHPKVLHPICGRPMLAYVLDLAKELKAYKTVAVLGHLHQEVGKVIEPGIKIVLQKKLLGSGDAVKEALAALKGFRGTVLVLYADNPLLKLSTLKDLLKRHLENNSDVTLLTAQLKKPAGYGRILRDKLSSISGIIEEKDADDFEKDIKEINTGIICFKKESLIDCIKEVRPNNRKKEYYLTDTVEIFYKKGLLIDNLKVPDIEEALGVNSRVDLARANSIMQKRINEKFMLEGVTIVDPNSTFISYGTKIGQDTTIYPFTVIESDVKIGKRCYLGPFIHLREGTYLEDEVVLGNFLEVVRCRISSRTRAQHFCYLGDSQISRQVNIGAGTVTANFDGKKKNRTVIKQSASIGSDTVLVAPVKIGKNATTGAGSVVIRDVSDNSKVAGVPAKPLKPKR